MAELDPLHVVVDRHIRQALDAHGGQVARAAKAISVGRATLYRWLGGSRVAASPSVTFAKQERRRERARVLAEAREAWRGCQNVGAFTRWLNEQIEEAGGQGG